MERKKPKIPILITSQSLTKKCLLSNQCSQTGCAVNGSCCFFFFFNTHIKDVADGLWHLWPLDIFHHHCCCGASSSSIWAILHPVYLMCSAWFMKRTAVGNQQCVESGGGFGGTTNDSNLKLNKGEQTKHGWFPRGQRARGVAHLVVFEPGEALGGQHEPVLLGSSLHDADVVDGQPAFADDLEERRVQKVTGSGDVRSPRGDLAMGAGRRCVMVHQWVGVVVVGWGCDFGCYRCCALVRSHSTSRGLRWLVRRQQC